MIRFPSLALVEARVLAQNKQVVEGNISPRERRKRLLVGIIALAAGVGVASALPAKFGFGWLAPILLFWLAGLGLFQAKEKT